MPFLNSVAHTYLRSGPFMTLGSGIRNMFYRIPDLWARIQNAYIGKLCDNVLGKKFQWCGSGMCIPDPASEFFLLDPGSEKSPSQIADPASASKNLIILITKKSKKMFLSCKKYDPGCSSRIPDPDANFLPIPDPGSRGQKGTRSWIWICNTENCYNFLKIGKNFCFQL